MPSGPNYVIELELGVPLNGRVLRGSIVKGEGAGRNIPEIGDIDVKRSVTKHG